MGVHDHIHIFQSKSNQIIYFQYRRKCQDSVFRVMRDVCVKRTIDSRNSFESYRITKATQRWSEWNQNRVS